MVGFYIPVERDQEQTQRALDRLAATVGKVLADTSMTEDDLAELLDLRRRPE